jgi:hypothetical protein
MSSIAILVPVCSRNQNYKNFKDIPFVHYLHKSLLSTIDAQHEYTIFIGIDSTDTFYVEHLGDFLFLNAPANLVIKPIILYDCEHKPAFAWNKLFQEAYDRGHDYFFQIGDDVEISGNWTKKFIESIESNNGVGVTGCLEKWNAACRRAKGQQLCLENAFVGRKHYELFGSFFNPVIENWFCDEWITQVYFPDYVTVHDNLEVKNKVRYDGDNAVGECAQQDNQSFRYKVKNIDTTEFDRMIQSDRKKVFGDQLNFNNKLCIALICTKKEYQRGQVDKAISAYISRAISSNYTFDFYIFFDQGKVLDYQGLKNYEACKNIRSINIQSINLSEHENVYSQVWQDHEVIGEFYRLGCPEYGITSGPNRLFFESMKFLKNKPYENILLIEPDTRPIKDYWYDYIVNYISCNEFLIGGSSYKGDREDVKDKSWSNHLNGVAIYRNCNALHSLLEKSEKYLRYLIKNSKRIIDTYQFKDISNTIPKDENINYLCVKFNYDVLLYFVSNSDKVHKTQPNQLKNTPIITNMSLCTDYNISEKQVLDRYPQTIILHQKF